MTTPFDFIPEYIKIAFVLSVTFGFFTIGCLKAHKEHKQERQQKLQELEA